jgi:putative component of membrane protein insertase Oxa1/YidC/SpoIIIJ protein YidD/TM2 domain-containing membrane protein YozV
LIIINQVYSEEKFWPYQSSKDLKYLYTNLSNQLRIENEKAYPFSYKTFLNPIAIYHRTLSVSSCKFFPSCSRYTYLAIDRFGISKGLILGAERLNRCNPFVDDDDYVKLGHYLYDPPGDFFAIVDSNRIRIWQSINKNLDKFIDSAFCPESYSRQNKVSDKPASEYNDLLIPLFPTEKIKSHELGFACFLYNEKQFYRAVTEFYRYLHQFPDDQHKNSILLLIACSNFEARRFSDAAEIFNKVFTDKLEDDIYIFSQFMRGLSLFYQNQYYQAQHIWYELLQNNKEKYLKNVLLVCLFSVSIIVEDLQRVSFFIERNDTTQIEQRIYSKYLEFSKNKKSPLRSGIFSAIIPGTGQVYSGRTKEGVIALITNLGLGFLVYDSFKDNRGPATNTINSLIGLQFYLGNIIGAKRSAEIYNQQKKQKIIDELNDICSIPNDFLIIEKDHTIYLQVK